MPWITKKLFHWDNIRNNLKEKTSQLGSTCSVAIDDHDYPN